MRSLFFLVVVLLFGCDAPEKGKQSWSFDSSIRALSVAPNGAVWWAGSNGLVGYTRDKGATWTVDTLRLLDGTLPAFRSIAVTNKAAFVLTIASPAVLYRMAHDESVWRRVYVDTDSLAFFDSMAFWDAEEGIAMGDPVESCLSILLTRDGGNTWNRVPCDILPPVVFDTQGVKEAAFAASNGNIALWEDEVWVVSGGLASRVFVSKDRGRSWQVNSTPIVQGGAMTGMFSAARCGEMNGIGWGGDWERMDDNARNKVVTADGGQTWSALTPESGPGYRSCVQYVPETDCQGLWAVGTPGISISEDGGDTWTTLPDSSFYTVRFTPNGDAAWLAGRGRVERRSLRTVTQ